MKAIFLCERTDKIFRVYDDKVVCELQKLTKIEKKIYNNNWLYISFLLIDIFLISLTSKLNNSLYKLFILIPVILLH